MSKHNSNLSSDRRAQDDSVIGKLLSLPFVLLSMLLVSAFVSSIIEVIGMAFEWWQEPGILHSEQMLMSELNYIDVVLAKNIFTKVSGLSVQELFDSSVGYLFDFANSLGQFNSVEYEHGFGAYVGAVVNMILITFLRFFVFLFTLPLYFIFAYVAFVIGLFERDRRRAGGGRESGTRFSLAKKSIFPSISLALFIYLAWPNSINPVFVFFPSALLCAIAITYMSTYYKKYT